MKKKFFVVFWLLALLARGAITVGDVVLSPMSLVDPQMLSVGRDANGRDFLCYIGRGLDGTPAILREGALTPLVVETELPGGHRLGAQFGCVADQSGSTTVYLTALHPNRTLAGLPVIRVMMKSGGVLTTLLESEFTTFSAPNPRADNISAFYTYTQAARVEVTRSGKLVVVGIFSPPSEVPGAAPIPQFMIVEWAGGQWKVVFNNSVDRRTNHFYSPVAYCTTGSGVLYIAAQALQTDKGAGVYRIKEGKPTLVRNQSAIIGTGLNCGEGGVQVYAADEENFRYSYIADNAMSETVFFIGRVVDTVALSSRDTMAFVSPTEAYVVANRSLVRVGGGVPPRLTKTPQQSPSGNILGVVLVDGRPLLLQQEKTNKAYWIFRPRLSGNISGRPGETVKLAGTDLVVESKVPTLSLMIGGKDVDYWPSTLGEIAIVIPKDAVEGNYEAVVDVFGIKLSATLTVRGQAELPAPTITAVVNGASLQSGPLAPRMPFVVYFSGLTGFEEAAGDAAVFEIGGMSAFFDDYPVRLLYNNGTGQLTGVVPGYAALQSAGRLVLKARQTNGTFSASAPITVAFLPSVHTLYQYGEGVPVMTDDQGRLVGSRLNPAVRGSTVTAYGTGCGQPPDLQDDKNVTQEIVLPSTPTFTMAGLPAEVKSVSLLPDPIGTCAYKVAVPDTANGRTSFWFGGDMPLGPKYAMWVQ